MDKWASKHTCTNVPFDKIFPCPHLPLPHQGGQEIGEMNTADGTDRKEKKIDKKDGYNIVLGYFPMSQQNKTFRCK